MIRELTSYVHFRAGELRETNAIAVTEIATFLKEVSVFMWSAASWNHILFFHYLLETHYATVLAVKKDEIILLKSDNFTFHGFSVTK